MNYLDLEELAMFLTCLPDEREDEIEDVFFKKYSIDLNQAFDLIKDLLPLCMVSESPLTKKLYQGFATNQMWLVKRELIQSRVGKGDL